MRVTRAGAGLFDNHEQLRGSNFDFCFVATPKNFTPPFKTIDMPHILNNVRQHFVKNDEDIQKCMEKIDELNTLLEQKGRQLPRSIPRIVVTRWDTYQKRAAAAYDIFAGLVANPKEEIVKTKHTNIIKEGLDKMTQLRTLSDIAQSQRASFFTNLHVIGELHTLCSKNKDEPDETKALRDAIVVPKHRGPKNREVPESDRWSWMMNDLVVVIASLCPHFMVTEKQVKCKRTVPPDAGRNLGQREVSTEIQRQVFYSGVVFERLREWFSLRVAQQYRDVCESGGDILIAVPQFGKFASGCDDETALTITDCENFWIKFGNTYPEFEDLAGAVKSLFTLPSAEAECERLFSLMKHIVTDKRKSLSPENIEACCLVRVHHPLFSNGKFHLDLPSTTKQQAERHHGLTVSRLVCRAIVAYHDAATHNKRIEKGELLDKYRVDAVKAFLWPDDDQTHFKNGLVSITIGHTAADLATVRNDKVPLELVTFRTEQSKTTRAKNTLEEEKDSECACGRLFSDHPAAVGGLASCVDCAQCVRWFHMTCTGYTNRAYAAMVGEIARETRMMDEGRIPKVTREFICGECRATKRSAAADRRRTRVQVEADEDFF